MPENLSQFIHKGRRLAQAVAQHNFTESIIPLIGIKMIAWQLLRAIGYLHALRIMHRDVKPQNILIDPSSYAIKLCDFGSAKKMEVG